MIKQMFEVADENKHKVLVLDEFKQFSLYVLEAISGLNIAQSNQTVGEMFTRFDANKDGKLDWDEIWTSIQPLQAKIKAKAFKWTMEPTIEAVEF